MAVKAEDFSSLSGPCPEAFHIKVTEFVVAAKKVGSGVGGRWSRLGICPLYSLLGGEGMTYTSCCSLMEVGLGWIWLCGFGWIQVCGSQGGAYLGLYLGPVF